MEKYGIHLLALSHVYLVPQLKQRCTRALIRRLTAESVVDVLQLARLFDAPDLYIKCLKLVHAHFKSVEATEGWKFLQNHDPWLELEILRFMDEAELVRSHISSRYTCKVGFDREWSKAQLEIHVLESMEKID